ncbi:predicted protein [Naegleria gruberi]|uniref:Predicted protein n=1 Tax=Naegleria gruberi TaxID=5762 RepID=D2UZE7_NAEGR|nr:uncharacterized protein NAEGRDRAFT_61910 [Naegleria gruberi]EFC49936.1 predicted protein [Naegleria gruberi]|eukprot:XP_002682680.1 predicted protein [Naegleria gruberi strain NEG-M]
MGVSQSTFSSLPKCVCDNQLSIHEENMDGEAHWIESSQKFCPQCKRLLKKQPLRKHQSFSDSLLQKTESASSVYLSSSKSLPSVNRNGHLVPSTPPKSALTIKLSTLASSDDNRPVTCPSTPPKPSKLSTTTSSPMTSPNFPSLRGSSFTSPQSSSSFDHYSFQTKLARSSSKNLMLLGATPIPIVKVKKKPSCHSLPTFSPPLSPPKLEKLEPPSMEDVQKIALNLGTSFPNHGTKSFPIYILPPQEAPEYFNPKGKKLGDHRSQMEDKQLKRRFRRVIVQ